MKLGSVHVAGPQAWPDHVLDASTGGLVCGLVLAIWRLAVGVEVHGGRGRNPWVQVYVGWWSFEVYWDRDGSWELDP